MPDTRLATLDSIPQPADAIRVDDWDDTGQRCFTVWEHTVHTDTGSVRVAVTGVQDFTGNTLRNLYVNAGSNGVELSADQARDFVTNFMDAVERVDD